VEIMVVMGYLSRQITNGGAAQRKAEAVEYRCPVPRVDNRPIAAHPRTPAAP